jgi:hypothetical protein
MSFFPLMKQIRIYVAPAVIRQEVKGAHRIRGTIINHFIKQKYAIPTMLDQAQRTSKAIDNILVLYKISTYP